MLKHIERLIRDIPNFPKPGIVFKDITPVLADGAAFSAATDWYAEKIKENGGCDLIAGVESRGFIFGAAVAQKMRKGLVLIRKPGKLPHKTHRIDYALEYGNDALEIHTDAVRSGQRIALIDDLIATGGTVNAACQLIQHHGAEISQILFLIELEFLGGRKKITAVDNSRIHSLMRY